jgi:hypothetical protein
MVIFHCYVSLPEGITFYNLLIAPPTSTNIHQLLSPTLRTFERHWLWLVPELKPDMKDGALTVKNADLTI